MSSPSEKCQGLPLDVSMAMPNTSQEPAISNRSAFLEMTKATLILPVAGGLREPAGCVTDGGWLGDCP